jgi:transposase
MQCFGPLSRRFFTKLHAVVDAKGRPLYATLTPGHRHEMTVADELLEHAQGQALIGDTGYDSNDLARKVRRKGMKVVICNNPTRKRGRRRLDRKLYRRRYLVECFFHHLKRFRAIATRYEKTGRNYLALVHLACAWLWLV